MYPHHSNINKRGALLTIGLLFIASLLAGTTICRAQTFSKEGLYTPPPDTTSLYPDTFKPRLANPIPPNTKAAIADFKKQLLPRVSAALYNLQSDSLKLKDMYTSIWGLAFYNKFVQDLTELKSYLENTGVTANGNYMPTIHILDSLSKLPIYQIIDDKAVTTPNLKGFALTKTDLLQKWLYETYNADLHADNRIPRTLDFGYLNGWRQLEAWYAQAIHAKQTALQQKADLFNFDSLKLANETAAIARIDTSQSAIAKKISNSTFIKNWLWYSNSIPGFNPLIITTAEKRYPYAEKNTFFTADKQKLQDTINKSGLLDEFKRTAKYYNQLLVPIKNPVDKDDYYVMEYDASKNFKLLDTLPENTLSNKKKLKVVVYNAPADQKLVFTPSEDKLAYESQAITEINTLADKVGIVTALASPNVALFNKLAGQLNQPGIKPVQLATPAVTVAYMVRESTTTQGSTKSNNPNIRFPPPPVKTERVVTGPVTAITLKNGRYVPLTNKDFDGDKKRILLAGNDEPKYSPFYIKVTDEFIKEDKGYFLNYSNERTFNRGLVAMTDRFNAFTDTINQHMTQIDDLIQLADAKLKVVEPFVRIVNRSLPPEAFKDITDTIPLLRTYVFTPKVPDAPKKLLYSVTTQPAKGKADPKEVTKQSINVIETQRFDFSIGLGYTFPEYSITKDGQPLPSTTLGDHFQFQAGLHVYLKKKINKLHDAPFQFNGERFSFYAGLSIAHALDNYYTGISYDVVPGIKVIGGCHFYKNYRFKIVNNTVADKASGISTAGAFISFNLEPATVIKAIGLFK